MGIQTMMHGDVRPSLPDPRASARRWLRRRSEERGAQLVEYALILSLVAALSIPILEQIGLTVFDFFASYISGLNGNG